MTAFVSPPVSGIFGRPVTGRLRPGAMLGMVDDPPAGAAPGLPAPGTFGNAMPAQAMPAAKPLQADMVGGGNPAPANGPLGVSMRQPFDYKQAYTGLLGDQRGPGTARRIAAYVAAALGNPYGLQAQQQQALGQAQRRNTANEALINWQREDWERQNAADLAASAPFTIGRSRLQFNPGTGETQALYTGPEDFDLYAQGLGLEPGSEEYFRAVEDYVLRSSGPSAFERDLELDDHRTANDAGLEGLRQNNRVSLEGLRHGNRVSLRGIPQARAPSVPRPTGSRSQSGGNLPVVSSPADASRLPPGSQFRTPDGRVMRVPAR